MKQFHWLVCIAKNCDWSRKIMPLSNLTWTSLLVEWEFTVKSRIKLRNLQILKKMLENSCQFLSSEQSCELKSLDVALNIAGVEKYARKTCGCTKSGVHSIRGLNERSISDDGICVLCGWWFSNQFEIVWKIPFSCDTVGCELWWAMYFSRCCALKRTGTFASESKVMCLF